MNCKAIWLFFLVSSWVLAQDRTVVFGAIQFEYQGVEYENVIVSNLQTGQTFITNMLGQFQVIAKPGDELEFKGINVFEKYVIVTEDNYQKKSLFVLLEPLVIPLNDLEVTGFKFSGNLEVDIKRVQIRDTLSEAIAKMGIPVSRERDEWKHINTPVLSSITSLDLDALYDIISGEKKRKIALYNFNRRKELVKGVRAYFKDDFFTESLEIPIEEIDPFVLTLIELGDLQAMFDAHDYYSIMAFMKELAPEYKKRLQLRKTNGNRGYFRD